MRMRYYGKFGEGVEEYSDTKKISDLEDEIKALRKANSAMVETLRMMRELLPKLDAIALKFSNLVKENRMEMVENALYISENTGYLYSARDSYRKSKAINE